MKPTMNIILRKEPSLTEWFQGLLERLFCAAMKRRDGRAQPKIEEPDEENRGYEDIMPGREGTPDSGAEPERETPTDPDHPDVSVPEDTESLPTYRGEREEALPSDITGTDNESSDREQDPSTEEDIPLRPSEVDVPDEVEHEESEEGPEIIPDHGKDNPEVGRPDEGPEIEKPERKEVDPGKSQDE